MKGLRGLQGVWRLLRVSAHVLHGLWLIRRHFGHWTMEQRQHQIGLWSRQLLHMIGVQLVVQGQAAPGPVLVVANHVSWLDIVVINAHHTSCFVSKADVQHWPLLGPLITGAGTLLIERERPRDALRVVHLMAERLQNGAILAAFPEGTTSDGEQVLPFHANLLQAAISSGAPVQALALRYRDARSGQPSSAPLFIGDTYLVTSLWRTLCAGKLRAELHWAGAETAQGRERRQWANALRSEVVRMLQLPNPTGTD